MAWLGSTKLCRYSTARERLLNRATLLGGVFFCVLTSSPSVGSISVCTRSNKLSRYSIAQERPLNGCTLLGGVFFTSRSATAGRPRPVPHGKAARLTASDGTAGNECDCESYQPTQRALFESKPGITPGNKGEATGVNPWSTTLRQHVGYTLPEQDGTGLGRSQDSGRCTSSQKQRGG